MQANLNLRAPAPQATQALAGFVAAKGIWACTRTRKCLLQVKAEACFGQQQALGRHA